MLEAREIPATSGQLYADVEGDIEEVDNKADSKNNGKAVSKDDYLMDMVSEYVYVPEEFLSQEYLNEAGKLVVKVKERENKRIRLLEAALLVRLKKFGEAVALYDKVARKLEGDRKKKRRKERFLGTSDELIKYREEVDVVGGFSVADLLLMARAYKSVGNQKMFERIKKAVIKKDPEKTKKSWKRFKISW